MGVRISGGTGTAGDRVALVPLCADGEPSLGPCGVERRDRPRGRHSAEVCRSVGTEAERYRRVFVRTSGHGGEQQGDFEAARICGEGDGEGRGVLDPASPMKIQTPTILL